MATVLFAWELGSGIGHLMRLRPFVEHFCRRGDRVVVVLRELSRTRSVFNRLEVTCIQAPVWIRQANGRIDPARTFAHVLHNNGFSRPEYLHSLGDAWRNILDSVEPDLIVFDHAPMALLTARACLAKKIVIGTGFCCPPDISPLPDLRIWMPEDPEQLAADEQLVLDNANTVLRGWGVSPLERLSQLYSDVDDTILLTFPELDHYGERPGAQYMGILPTEGGRSPEWPDGKRKRIFAYLKPFPALPHLLERLKESKCPTLVYADGIDMKTRGRFQSSTLHFEQERLDIKEVARQCDLAILNGNHGTTASMLLAGKPIMQLPIVLEQATTAGSTLRLGAGTAASIVKPEQITEALDAILDDGPHTSAAEGFAARHKRFDSGTALTEAIRRCEECAE